MAAFSTRSSAGVVDRASASARAIPSGARARLIATAIQPTISDIADAGEPHRAPPGRPEECSWRRSPEPEAHMGGTDGRADRGRELGTHRIEIHLAGETRREGVERAAGVVARAVEPEVDRGLDAPEDGLEQREAQERRYGDGELGSTGERTQRGLQDDDAGEERDRDRRGRRAIHERPIDENVDVVQVIAEHRERDGERHDLKRTDEEELPDLALLLQASARREAQDEDADAEGEGLHLLALDPARATEARHDGHRGGERASEQPAVPDDEWKPWHPGDHVDHLESWDAERVVHEGGVVQRSVLEREDDAEIQGGGDRGHAGDPPAW